MNTSNINNNYPSFDPNNYTPAPSQNAEPITHNRNYQSLTPFDSIHHSSNNNSLPLDTSNSIGGILENLNGLLIKKRTDWQAEVTGCERNHKYKIKASDREHGPLLMITKEKSSSLKRCLLHSNIRPFTLYLKDGESGVDQFKLDR